LHLGQEIDRIFRAPIQLGMPLLAAEALDLGHGRAVHAGFGKRFAHIVETKRLDDGCHHFHGTDSLQSLPGGAMVTPFPPAAEARKPRPMSMLLRPLSWQCILVDNMSSVMSVD